MVNEERLLIEAGQQGNVESFNQLVRLYEGRIYNICYRMLNDSDAAADAAQETFISAFRNLRSFRGGSFRSWITRIAVNACYDIMRVRKRRPTISLDTTHPDDDTQSAYDPIDQGETPDEFALRQELGAAIQAGLTALPEDQRIVLILSDIQGMAYEEIALITGANLGTVKSRLSRGRTRLRDFLKAGELLPLRYRHENE